MHCINVFLEFIHCHIVFLEFMPCIIVFLKFIHCITVIVLPLLYYRYCISVFHPFYLPFFLSLPIVFTGFLD